MRPHSAAPRRADNSLSHPRIAVGIHPNPRSFQSQGPVDGCGAWLIFRISALSPRRYTERAQKSSGKEPKGSTAEAIPRLLRCPKVKVPCGRTATSRPPTNHGNTTRHSQRLNHALPQHIVVSGLPSHPKCPLELTFRSSRPSPANLLPAPSQTVAAPSFTRSIPKAPATFPDLAPIHTSISAPRPS